MRVSNPALVSTAHVRWAVLLATPTRRANSLKLNSGAAAKASSTPSAIETDCSAGLLAAARGVAVADGVIRR